MKALKSSLIALTVILTLGVLVTAWADCSDDKAQCREYCGDDQSCLADCDDKFKC